MESQRHRGQVSGGNGEGRGGTAREDRMTVARSILGIPTEILPLAFVPLGRPRGVTAPKDKWRPEFVHRGRW